MGYFGHVAIAANLDERTPAGPEDVTMEVEERARGGAGVPDRHLPRLLFVSDIDGVPNFSEILVRLDECPARRLPELRRGRDSRPFHELPQEAGRIVQGSQRTPAAKRGVQVPPGARDLGPRLLRRLLQDRDEDAVSYDVTDRRPFAADDNEHVDIGVRTVLRASGGAIHPDGHEVPTLARTKLARQGLRELEPARGRSEERRVGKECRERWSRNESNKKER